MRVLLEYCFDHVSARVIYGAIGWSLRFRGIAADVVRTLEGSDVSAYDLLVSHDAIDEHVRPRPRLGSYGGRLMSRPDSLALVARMNIPVMRWSLAQSREEVLALFDLWQADRLLLKKSGTRKGAGVSVFDRANVERVQWDPAVDLFCPEVDPAGGDVYKAEFFNGRIILCWHSRRAPLHVGFTGYREARVRQLQKRRLCRFSATLEGRVRALSAALTEAGVGYCSLDMMRRPDGELVAIELNTAQVATWWTARFPQTSWRYAAAVRALVARLGAAGRG